MQNSEPGHGQYGPNIDNVRLTDPGLVFAAESAAFQSARRELQDSINEIDNTVSRALTMALGLAYVINDGTLQGAPITQDYLDAHVADLLSATESANRLISRQETSHIQLRNSIQTLQRKARLLAIEASSRNQSIVSDRLSEYTNEALYIIEACHSHLRDQRPLFTRDFARDRLSDEHFPIFSGWFGRGLRQNVIAELLGVSAPTVMRFVRDDIPTVVRALGQAGQVAETAELIGLKAIVPPTVDSSVLARGRRSPSAPDQILVNNQHIAVVEVKNFAIPYKYPQTGVIHEGELIPGYCSPPEPDGDTPDGLWIYPGVYRDFENTVYGEMYGDPPMRVTGESSLVPDCPMTTVLSLVSWSGTSDTDRIVALHWLGGAVSFHPAGIFRPWPGEYFETDGVSMGYVGPNDVDEWFLSCDPNDYARFINSFEKEPPPLARCLEVLGERHPPLGTYDGPSDASKFLEWLAGMKEVSD